MEQTASKKQKERLYVYLAGPLTKPEPFANVGMAIHAAERIRAVTAVLSQWDVKIYVPHLMTLWQLVHPADYAIWMDECLGWVEQCNALVRIPGESSGSDREVLHARSCGIPAFAGSHPIEDFLFALRKTNALAEFMELARIEGRL